MHLLQEGSSLASNHRKVLPMDNNLILTDLQEEEEEEEEHRDNHRLSSNKRGTLFTTDRLISSTSERYTLGLPPLTRIALVRSLLRNWQP